MKARQLVAGASLGPEALKVAYAAFDQAWETIAANFGNDNDAAEAARLKLANAILAVMREDSRDPARSQERRPADDRAQRPPRRESDAIILTGSFSASTICGRDRPHERLVQRSAARSSLWRASTQRSAPSAPSSFFQNGALVFR